jgi:hypothetical protein
VHGVSFEQLQAAALQKQPQIPHTNQGHTSGTCTLRITNAGPKHALDIATSITTKAPSHYHKSHARTFAFAFTLSTAKPRSKAACPATAGAAASGRFEPGLPLASPTAKERMRRFEMSFLHVKSMTSLSPLQYRQDK